MAGPSDYIQLDAGTGGDKMGTDTVGGVKFQEMKVNFGAAGTVTNVSETNPLPVSNAGNGEQNLIFSRLLDTVGDGTGTKNATGNYSGGATTFKILPPASTIFRVTRLLVYVKDTAGMVASEYGNLGSALTNGIQIRVHNGTTTVVDLTDGDPITENADYGKFCYDVQVLGWGAGDDILLARWTFSKAGQDLRLDGDATEALEVILNDDFSGLLSHKFIAQGYTENTGT